MKTQKLCGLKPAIVLFLIAICGVSVLNAQTSPDLRLVIRSGLVEVQRGNSWFPISIGDVLKPGDHVRTATGSTASLQLMDGIVTLNEATQVQIGQSTSSPIIQIEGGSLKVFAGSDVMIATKDTLLEAVERPLDLELGYQGDKLNMTVFNGAVRAGSITIRGGSEDSRTRSISAGRSGRRNEIMVPNPRVFVYPYFMYGNDAPIDGRIVPPVVNNPTHPGYRPTQIVSPMSDPLRVPVTKP